MDHINETKRNIKRQATKILHDIGSAYDRGVFDDPQASSLFCTLLALVCEGKIEGLLDEEQDQIKWSLTPRYEKQMADFAQRLAEEGPNVVRGPW